MLKPLIQIALKLLHIKVKKTVIIQAPMESMRQSVMYYNLYKLKVMHFCFPTLSLYKL